MESVMGDLKGRSCFIYIDDIVVYSASVQQHLHHLQEVFDCLHRAGLTLNLRKCNLLQTSLNFLGHMVSKDSISMEPRKIELVRDFPQPRSFEHAEGVLATFRVAGTVMDDLPVDWSELAKAQDEDDALEPLRQIAKDPKAKEDRIHFVVRNGMLFREVPRQHQGVVTQLIREARENKGDLVVLWLDLTNAYGSIPHKLVEEVLHQHHIPNKFKDHILDYNESFSLRVCAETTTSD
ncbi:hypothetical protein SRHO_G00068500 [Serrasalmus rhombeus]